MRDRNSFEHIKPDLPYLQSQSESLIKHEIKWGQRWFERARHIRRVSLQEAELLGLSGRRLSFMIDES